MNIKNNPAINLVFQGLLFAYPSLLLTLKGGMSASFILLVVLSTYLILVSEKGSIRQDLDRVATLFGLAMSATFLSVLLSQIYHMEMIPRAFDSPARFLLAIPIFLVLRDTKFKVLGMLQYGIPVAAILIGAIIWISGQKIYATTSFLYYIHLGDLALMLGFMSILSIDWTHKDSRWLVGLKVFGLFAGLYVSLVSGARGGWIAIPIFFLVWILTSQKFSSSAIVRLSVASVIIVSSAVFSYFLIDVVHIRVMAAISDLTSVDPDTSLGIRFQLWDAAVRLFLQHPIMGVGPEGFGLAMDKMADSGVITQIAAGIGKGEAHSYYFSVLARFGAVGIAALLLMFFVPLWLFYQALNSGRSFHRGAARMGIALVLGFIVFCLSVEMFNLKMIASFYGVTLAVLMAAATNRKLVE